MVFYFFYETKIILVWFGEQSGRFIIDFKNFPVSPSWKWEIPIGNYLHTERLRYLSLLKLIWDLFSKLIIDSQSLSFNRDRRGSFQKKFSPQHPKYDKFIIIGEFPKKCSIDSSFRSDFLTETPYILILIKKFSSEILIKTL